MNPVAVIKAFMVQCAGVALLLISLLPVLSICTPGTMLCASGGPDPLAWVAFGGGILLFALGTWMFVRLARATKTGHGDDVMESIPDAPEPIAAQDADSGDVATETGAESHGDVAPPPPSRRRTISASALADA